MIPLKISTHREDGVTTSQESVEHRTNVVSTV